MSDVQEIKNFFTDYDGQDYFSLSEISNHSAYSQDYLIEAVLAGQLKAFKVGDQWFTAHNWFEAYVNRVNQTLDEETKKVNNQSEWVKETPSSFSGWSMILSWRPVLVVLALLIGIGLGAFIARTNNNTLVKINTVQAVMTHQFLKITYDVYQSPINLLAKVVYGQKINDEKITQSWHGLVAGASESR